jgi:adenylyltransferase/sulfurtransferase
MSAESTNGDDLQIVVNTDDRFDRQKLITWWDQSKLSAARVLVVGAGALGNEIVKNLALVGVGHITIVDMDTIERSNLARCIFFRESDEGMAKSEVLAREVRRLNSEIDTVFYTCPVQELGDAFIADFTLVIAGLDNREARVWLGSAVRRIGKVWIDAAIEGLMGSVQTFTPDGPCYACSMNDIDWKAVAHRRSCKLLGNEEIEAGHTPTNATTSSIIAGIQTQEAIKYLVEEPDLYALENKVWRMFGEQMTTYTSIIKIDEDCPFHYDYLPADDAVRLPGTIADLWSLTQSAEGSTLSFYDDFILINPCATCGGDAKVGFKDVMKKQGKCSKCNSELVVDLCSRIKIGDKAASVTLNPDFWPLKSYVQFNFEGTSSRRTIMRSN